MLSSNSRLRFLLLVGLASCRQACGLTLAEDGSGGGGANAGGGGANAGGGGANGGGGGGGTGVGANGGNGSSSTNGGGGAVLVCDEDLVANFGEADPDLVLAGCGAAEGGTCDLDQAAGELRITSSADTGFWNGGESTFVHFEGGAQCDSFLAHTVVAVGDPMTAVPFSLAGLVVRDSDCPVQPGEANCNNWFKAEVGRLSLLPPTTQDDDVGLRSALHNGAIAVPPQSGDYQDLYLSAEASYQVAICAIDAGGSFEVQAAVRVGLDWETTDSFVLLAPTVEVGLVAATSSVSDPPFSARFESFEIATIPASGRSAMERCSAAFDSLP